MGGQSTSYDDGDDGWLDLVDVCLTQLPRETSPLGWVHDDGGSVRVGIGGKLLCIEGRRRMENVLGDYGEMIRYGKGRGRDTSRREHCHLAVHPRLYKRISVWS